MVLKFEQLDPVCLGIRIDYLIDGNKSGMF